MKLGYGDVGQQGMRELDTIEVMGAFVDGMWAKRLLYEDPTV